MVTVPVDRGSRRPCRSGRSGRSRLQRQGAAGGGPAQPGLDRSRPADVAVALSPCTATATENRSLSVRPAKARARRRSRPVAGVGRRAAAGRSDHRDVGQRDLDAPVPPAAGTAAPAPDVAVPSARPGAPASVIPASEISDRPPAAPAGSSAGAPHGDVGQRDLHRSGGRQGDLGGCARRRRRRVVDRVGDEHAAAERGDGEQTSGWARSSSYPRHGSAAAERFSNLWHEPFRSCRRVVIGWVPLGSRPCPGPVTATQHWSMSSIPNTDGPCWRTRRDCSETEPQPRMWCRRR